MKKIFLSLLIASLSLPASARHFTAPKDKVGILYIQMDGPIVKKEMRYFKPWNKLNLSRKSRGLLHGGLSKVIGRERAEKFRVGFIRVVNQDLQAATYYGDQGSSIVVQFSPDGNDLHCYISIKGNGLPGKCNF